MVDTQDPTAGGGTALSPAPHLRLVWSNPQPPRPRTRVDFALAIERHLTGADGLSRDQFLEVYSGRRRSPLALAPS